MTSSNIRPIAIALIVLITVGLLLVRVKSETNGWVEEELNYAIRTATTDATAVMVNEDYLMDGITNDLEKVTVNLDRAKERFEKSLYVNLGAAVDDSQINSMNIPMVGYVGYRYISGVLEDGRETFPWAYVHTVVPSGKDPSLWYTMYNFTLGDKIYVTEMKNGVMTDSILYLSTLPENYFSTVHKNKDFVTITIMECVNEFLNTFSNTGYSLQAMNAGSGLSFNLGTVDYVGDDESKITAWSSVIDGPGFFAVVDMFDPQMSGKVRTFTFGGAEFLSRY